MTELGALYGKITLISLPIPTRLVLPIWEFTDKYSRIAIYSKGKQGCALPFDA